MTEIVLKRNCGDLNPPVLENISLNILSFSTLLRLIPTYIPGWGEGGGVTFTGAEIGKGKDAKVNTQGLLSP